MVFEVFDKRKPIGMIDLSHLRQGTFKKMYRNDANGTWTIEYKEPNSLGNKIISNILDGSWIKIDQSFVGSQNDRYGGFIVLFAGEYGKSPFMEKYMGNNGVISSLIKKMSEMHDYNIMSKAAQRAVLEQTTRGASAILKEVTDNMKAVEEAQKKEMIGYPTRRRFP